MADPGDSFDVVVPSFPGYGFSSPINVPGINYQPEHNNLV
jgi:hypothetical protein